MGGELASIESVKKRGDSSYKRERENIRTSAAMMLINDTSSQMSLFHQGMHSRNAAL